MDSITITTVSQDRLRIAYDNPRRVWPGISRHVKRDCWFDNTRRKLASPELWNHSKSFIRRAFHLTAPYTPCSRLPSTTLAYTTTWSYAFELEEFMSTKKLMTYLANSSMCWSCGPPPCDLLLDYVQFRLGIIGVVGTFQGCAGLFTRLREAILTKQGDNLIILNSKKSRSFKGAIGKKYSVAHVFHVGHCTLATTRTIC